MKGVHRVELDGVELAERFIRPTGDGRSHTVVVAMG